LVPEPLLREVCGHLAGQDEARLGETLKNEVESFDYERALQTVAAVALALKLPPDAQHA
jgi:hypothetical protein